MREIAKALAGTGGVGAGCTRVLGCTRIIRCGTSGRESAASSIGPITLGVKSTGKRSAGNPHATFDAAGAGNGPIWAPRQSSTLLMREGWPSSHGTVSEAPSDERDGNR